ncbi:MAG: MtrB/PioB family outer membrane beta-barrel protein, partial [Magnetococcales bacterium]|nr:MtrB/PioB family outer membrane beta-barrel protein [Magnetococcales bacterium]
MHKTKTILTLAACASLGLWEGLALAEEATEDRAPLPKMSETAAPFTKPDSTVTLGIGFWDGNRQKNGIFDRVQGTETVGILDADINLRDDASGSWTILKARNLTAEDREAKIGYNKQGVWGVSLGYDEIPRYAPYTVLTKVRGLGNDEITMPNPQSNGTGGAFQIGTDRERFNLESFRFINKEWKFNLGLRYEKKEGTRHWGRGSAPEFVVEPIDWITRQADLSLSYLGKGTQLTGGYNGSWFENVYSVVDIIRQGDNPATLANHTYLSTPLDNDAHQFFLQGGHNFTPTTRANFKVAHTRANQNEFLGTADITGLAAATAPARLQGKVDTLLATVGLTAQPLPKLRLLTNLRYQ